MRRWLRSVRARACAPVDAASLVAFRVAFGLLMAASATRFWAKGWIHEQFIDPSFHFPYFGLWFVQPLPEPLMTGCFVLIGLSALSLASGAVYRWASLTFALSFSYVSLLDRALYLNHYYLVVVLSWLLALLPLGHARLHSSAGLRCVPAYVLWALRTQVGLVYVFAGVAKLNADWLVRAQPLRTWLAARSDVPWLGAWLAEPTLAFAASWAGALFDLTIVPLLLFPATRKVAFAAVIVFHAITGLLFPIGMFPWIMTACATLLLAADWPRRFVTGRWLVRCVGVSGAHGEIVVQPRPLVAVFLAIVVLQVAYPALQHARSSTPEAAWKGDGFDFTWRVMAAERAGHVELVAHDPLRRPQRLELGQLLTPHQRRAMEQDPKLIRALAKHVSKQLALQRGYAVPITADAYLSLNGRPARRLLRPDVDLGASAETSWVEPFDVTGSKHTQPHSGAAAGGRLGQEHPLLRNVAVEDHQRLAERVPHGLERGRVEP